ncbi:MAG: APC family permease, partial [Chroococcidiopsidaceae cyanobacterium CP_BM_ER_R8_30]|nr:APC family permease [Chroococcidiopsidaceae cyanobacterium CP_BM_ER_R8_30]
MSSFTRLKEILIGKTLPTSASSHERLNKAAALAVLSSDALSSVAYATEEILKVLVLTGSAPILGDSVWISVAIALLLLIITLSYQQTIRAYPSGGGAYIVASDNLGVFPGLVAGASLMIDYVLTVTVSVASGIDALNSVYPALLPFKIEVCLAVIFLIMLANLRGVRESGKIFMVPTYAFILSVVILIAVGVFKIATGNINAATPTFATEVLRHPEPLGIFLILRAFSQGCTALTGVEAISNGVPAFKPPEWKNARITMLYMGSILGSMFLGITFLANAYHITPDPTGAQTVLSLLARRVIGDVGPRIFGDSLLYLFLQYATLFILVLAANTSYADFPRLSSLLARDGFMPRQLALLGERLVYSNGVILLSIFGAILIVIFNGSVNALISLYALGVFTSFTLSQGGMVRHWYKEQSPGWQPRALMNGLGAVTTAVVLVVILISKFGEGAWIVVVAVPILVSIFMAIKRHYQFVAEEVSIKDMGPRGYIPRPKVEVVTHPAVVIVGQLNKGTVEALDYARSIADEIVGIHVDIGLTDHEKLQQQWQEL